MRRVWSLVAVCAAFGFLPAVSGEALAAAGGEEVGETPRVESAGQEAPTFTRDVLPILQYARRVAEREARANDE